MINVLFQSIYARTCVFVNRSEICQRYGFQKNEEHQMKDQGQFILRNNTQYFFVDSLSFSLGASGFNEIYEITSFSQDTKLNITFMESVANGTIKINNISVNFMSSVPLQIYSSKSKLTFNKKCYDAVTFDLHTLVNSISSVSQEVGVSLVDFNENNYVLISKTNMFEICDFFSIPNETYIYITPYSTFFALNNSTMEIECKTPEMSFKDQVVYIQQTMAILSGSMGFLGKNSQIHFIGEWKNSCVYFLDSYNLSLIIDTFECASLRINTGNVKVVFPKPGIYHFQELPSAFVDCPYGTVIEYTNLPSYLNISSTNNLEVRYQNIGQDAKELFIDGTLRLSGITNNSSIKVNKIIFGDVKIGETMIDIECNQAEGRILIDEKFLGDENKNGKKLMKINEEISKLKIEDSGWKDEGKIMKYKKNEDNEINVWKEEIISGRAACIASNGKSECITNGALIYRSIEMININDKNEVIIENIIQKIIHLEIEHKMNISLIGGIFTVNKTENIEILNINDSEFVTEQNINCKTLNAKNSTLSNTVIGENVTVNLLYPIRVIPTNLTNVTIELHDFNIKQIYMESIDILSETKKIISIPLPSAKELHLCLFDSIVEKITYDLNWFKSILFERCSVTVYIRSICTKSNYIIKDSTFWIEDSPYDEPSDLILFENPTNVINSTMYLTRGIKRV